MDDLTKQGELYAKPTKWAPLLPLALAERLRTPCYVAAIGLVLVVLGRLLHVEAHAAGLPALLLLVAVGTAAVWMDREHVSGGANQSDGMYPAMMQDITTRNECGAMQQKPATGDTIKLYEVR